MDRARVPRTERNVDAWLFAIAGPSFFRARPRMPGEKRENSQIFHLSIHHENILCYDDLLSV